IDLHSLRQALPDVRQLLPYLPGNVEWIGNSLFDNSERNGALSVEAHSDTPIHRAELDACDVSQPHRIAGLVFDDNRSELLGEPQIGFRKDGELYVPALDPPCRQFDILAP